MIVVRVLTMLSSHSIHRRPGISDCIQSCAQYSRGFHVECYSLFMAEYSDAVEVSKTVSKIV